MSEKKRRKWFDRIPFAVAATMIGFGISNFVFKQPQGMTWILAGIWVIVHEIIRRKWDKLGK